MLESVIMYYIQVYTTIVTSNPTTAPRPGLSTGGKVGIGLGVPIALFVISITLWICYRFGKHSERARKDNVTSAYFQSNTELPDQHASIIQPIQELA